jgi:F420-dependent oxidoreductase-like protein
MRIGLHIGHWGGLTGEAQIKLVRYAESLGYDSVWSSESYSSDAATVLAWLAGQTQQIKLGSAIFQLPGRSPAMTAMTAATLDQLSNGRMRLGLGTSGPQVAEGWHGQPFEKQLQRTREYVDIVRMALAGERVAYNGGSYVLPIEGGRGKALKLMIRPVQGKIPIYIAAMGPKNTALTGEIADGWLATFLSPEYMPEAKKLLAEGAKKRESGRLPADFDIAPTVLIAIDDDIDRARDLMRPVLALYVGGMGPRDGNFYNHLVSRYGFEDAARKVQDLYLDGRTKEAAAAVPDELIDQTTLAGPAAHIKRRLAIYADTGVGTLMLTPKDPTPEGRVRLLRTVAELL